MLVKSLQKYGNSYALIIDKPLMDAMGITPETVLQVTVDSGHLTLRPQNVGFGQQRVNELMDEVVKVYDKALTKLSQ